MRYALVKCNDGKRVKTYRLELLTSKIGKGPSGADVLIVSGYKVNKSGEYIGPANVDEIQVIVGADSIQELEEDWKYGELVAAGTASQHSKS